MNCFLDFLKRYDLLIQFAAVVLTLIGLFFVFYAYRIAKKTLDVQQRQLEYYFSPLSFEFIIYDFSDTKKKSISIIFENKSPVPNRVSIITLVYRHYRASPDWIWLGAFSTKEEITINPSDRKSIIFYSQFSYDRLAKFSDAEGVLVLNFSDIKGYDYDLEIPFGPKKRYYNVTCSSGRKLKNATSFLSFNGEIKATYSLTEL